LQHLHLASYPIHLPPSCIVFWSPQHQVSCWSISVLLHVQTTFLHVTSSSLDDLGTSCPPGASPSSSMCKLSPSTSRRLLVSSPPDVLLDHLHAPPHPTTDTATCLCPPVTPAHAPGCITAVLSLPTCPATGLLSPAPPPMGHCLSHHEPQHGFAIQPGLGDNPSALFPCSARATTSHRGLGPGKTATLLTQLLPFSPCSRHRPQHGCQDGDRH